MAVSRRPNAICRFGAVVIFGALAAVAQKTPVNLSAADWLPDGAVYTLQINHPDAVVGVAANLGLTDMLRGNSSDKRFQVLIDSLTTHAGGSVTYALYPGENSVWVFDIQNALVLDTLQQFVKTMAGATSKTPAIFYQEYPGNVAAWSLDGKQFFARTGNRLVLANRGELLKTLFAAHAGSLGGSALYCQARHAAGPDPAAWAFINMAMVNQYPPAQKSLQGNDLYDVILNGALKQSLRNSTWLAVGLGIDGKKLRLHAVTDGRLASTGAGAFTLPGDAGMLPNLSVPRELAAVSLWRDLGEFYSQKETLFPEKTSGGILAENFLEIFFTGRDLNQEVFSQFQPQVRLVVARQQYDPKIGTPTEQYPAAAVIFRVAHDPEAFGEVLEEAWQKAVGLTNFTRGQSAEPGLLLDRESYGGLTFTYVAFSARGEKDRAHLPYRFNYRPAIVRDGLYIILSSTDGLAKDLIDAINKEDGRDPTRKSTAHTVIDVTSPEEIAALLNVNRTALIRQSVLSGGKNPEQAAREFDRNTMWLNKLGRARLSVSAIPEGHQADLEIDLK